MIIPCRQGRRGDLQLRPQGVRLRQLPAGVDGAEHHANHKLQVTKKRVGKLSGKGLAFRASFLPVMGRKWGINGGASRSEMME